MTLTVINPTSGALQLPERATITDNKPSKFIKEIGTQDSEAMFVLGPTTATKVPVLNKAGVEVHVNRLKITEVERDVVKRAESIYASFVKSENILLEAYPNGELKEEFPEHDRDRVPDSVREF